MEDGTKVQVLLAAVEERYKSLHIMRDRTQQTCMWITGIFLAVAGWIIQGKVTLTPVQKAFMGTVIVIAVIVIRWFYLRDIQKGFQAQQRAVARIEEALQLFTPGFYDGKESGVFPESWKKAGRENGEGRYFKNIYWMLYISAGVLIIALTSQGWIY